MTILAPSRTLSWIAVSFLAASAAWAAPAGQISETAGYVTVTNSQQAPVTAKKGAAIESGQVITTGANGQAVIKFQDGQIIALKSNSVFRVNKYIYDQAYPEKGETFFSLLQGGLRAVTGLIGAKNRDGWKLATPTATVGIRGTDFMIIISQSTYVKVATGAVSATNASGAPLILIANEAGVITSASVAGTVVPVSSLPAGLFAEIEAMSLTGALSGAAAAGSAAGSAVTIGGVPAWVVGVGVAAGAGAAAAAGGGADGGATTQH
jgi:hypothetical protein